MGDADRVLDQTAGPQKRGEARVHAAEGHLIHDGHQSGESLREQVKNEFAPEIVAFDPIATCGGRDDDGLGLLFHGGDGGEGDLVEDGVGREDAGLSQPEAVEGDLATGLADLVDAHDARKQECDAVHAVAFEEDIVTGGDACERCGLLKLADEGRVRILEQGQGLGEAGELGWFKHGSDHFFLAIGHRLKFGNDLFAVFHGDGDIVQRSRRAFTDFFGFGHEMVTCLGRIQIVDVHAEGDGHLSMRVAGRGKGNVCETEHDSPMSRPVEVEHGLGHRHRDAAVAGFHGFHRRADEIGVGVFTEEGEDFGINHEEA